MTLDEIKEILDPWVRQIAREETGKEYQGDALLNCREVRKMLGVDAKTLWRWRKLHLLPEMRIGRSPRFKLSDVLRLAGGLGMRRVYDYSNDVMQVPEDFIKDLDIRE